MNLISSANFLFARYFFSRYSCPWGSIDSSVQTASPSGTSQSAQSPPFWFLYPSISLYFSSKRHPINDSDWFCQITRIHIRCVLFCSCRKFDCCSSAANSTPPICTSDSCLDPILHSLYLYILLIYDKIGYTEAIDLW